MSAAETISTESFRSLEEMRDVHHSLLKQSRTSPSSNALNDEITRFMGRGRATGVLLDVDDDRTTAQSMLDYWSTIAMRNSFDAGDPNLESFAPGVEVELTDSDYPYQISGTTSDQQNALRFGTDRLVKECLRKLELNRLVAITGGTGSGRSTMVKFDLLPAIESGKLRDAKWTEYLVHKPGCLPLRALLKVLRPAGVGDTWIEEQTALMRKDSSHLARLLDARAGESAVIVFDPFEEVFTECEDGAERDTLSANLLGLIKESEGGHVVILLLRSDFVSYMDRLEALELVFDQSQVVMAFTTPELRQAIEEPAKRIGLRFEEGLVDRLLLDLQGDPAALGLLGFTMYQLWQRRTGCWITWDAYRITGGGGIALQKCADAVYKKLDATAQQACKAIFLKLFRPEVGFQVNSVSAGREQLLAAVQDEALLDTVFGQLLDARLVRISSQEDSGEVRYVATHEALTRHWIQLIEWLEEERVAKRKMRHLTQAAQQWVQKKREDAVLWQGSLLRDGLELMKEDETGQLERAFLIASKRRQDLRKVARYVSAAVVLSVLLIAYGWYWHVMSGLRKEKQLVENAQKEAAEAQSEIDRERGLAAKEQVSFLILKDQLEPLRNLESAAVTAADAGVLTQDFARSLLWNLEAAKRGSITRDTFDNANTMTENIRRHFENAERIRSEFQQSPNSKLAVNQPVTGTSAVDSDFDRYIDAFKQNKEQVSDKEFHVRRLALGIQQLPQLLSMVYQEKMSHAELSPDGSRLATAGGDKRNELLIWNTSDFADESAIQPMQRIDEFSDPINHLAWNAVGTRLAVALDTMNGIESVKLFVLDAGQELIQEATLNHDGPVLNVMFAGDAAAARLITVSNLTAAAALQTDRLSEPATPGEGLENRLPPAVGEPQMQRPILTFWDPAVPQKPRSVAPLDGKLINLEVSTDGTRLVTAVSSTDERTGSAQIWDALSGNLMQSFSEKLRSAPDTENKSMARQSVANTYSLPALGSTAVQFACLSPSNTLLAAISDKKVLVWKVQSGTESEPDVILHDERVTSIAFGPDPESNTVATTSQNTVRIFRLQSDDTVDNGKIKHQLLPGKIEHKSTIDRPAFSPDGLYLATPSRDQNAGVWEVAMGQLALPLMPHGGGVSRTWFTPDGQRLLTQRKDLIRIWALATENPPARSFSSSVPLNATILNADGSRGPLKGRVLSEDGSLLITASGFTLNDVSVWNTKSGERISLRQHDAAIACASLSGDGQYVVTATADKVAHVWESRTGKLLWSLPHTNEITFTDFGGAGTHLITVNQKKTNSAYPEKDTATCQIRVWQLPEENTPLSDPAQLSTMEAPATDVSFQVRQVMLDSDGQRLVAIGVDFPGDGAEKRMGRVLVREKEGVQVTFEGTEEFLYAAVFGAGQNTQIAAGSANDTAIVWRRNGKNWSKRILEGHQADVIHAAFSPDGKWLVTSGADSAARVWDLDRAFEDPSVSVFKESTTLRHTSGFVNAAAFSPDKQHAFVITGGTDGTTRVWEKKSGRSVCVFASGGEVWLTQFLKDPATQQHNIVTACDFRMASGGHLRIRRWGWEQPEQLKNQEHLETLLKVYAGQKWETDDELSGQPAAVVWEKFTKNPQRLVSNPVPSSHAQLVNDCLAVGQPWAANWHIKAMQPSRKDEGLLQKIARVGERFSDPESLLKSAQKNEELSRWKEANLEYNVAVNLQKTDPRMWEARGRHFERRGEWKSAASDYAEAIALSKDQTHWHLYQLLGAAQFNLRKWPEAAQSFRSALEAAESGASLLERQSLQAQLYHAEAWGHAIEQEWPEAIARFDAALLLAPSNPELLEQRVSALVRNGNWDPAIQYYDERITKEPGDDRHYWRRAVLQLKKASAEGLPPNDYKNTRSQVVQLFRETKLPRAANNVAWICSLAPPIDENPPLRNVAIELARLAVNESPKDRQFYLNTLGAAFYRDGQYDEAIGWLNEARRAQWINDSITKRLDRSMSETLSDDAGTVWDWLFLAMAFQKRDAPDEAQKWLTKVNRWVGSPPLANSLDPLSGWENDLELEILVDEARRLIVPGDETE